MRMAMPPVMRASGPVNAISRFQASGIRSLSEADLAHLWEGQRFPPEALRTTAGAPLRAVYRGRRTGGPGPDYRDAIISAPGGLLQGDVELHVRSSDFQRHGHARDPAYDGLALHLVFQHDGHGDTQLASGRRVSVVALADWVEGRSREIRAWLERPEQWQEPCRSAVARLGSETAGTALDRLGEMRFRQKAAAFAKRLAAAGADQALWEGVLEALGYGGQRELMLAVACRATWKAVSAAMLRVPAARRATIAGTLLLEALEGEKRKAWHGAGRQAGTERPRNRPEARLLGAGVLASRFGARGPWETLRPLVEAGDAGRLVAALTAPPGIGRGRALEMAANAVLPCAAAQGLGAASEALYRRLRLPARYGAVKHIHTALGGDVPLDTRRQQGMLYLLRQYCTQGGCGRCPLS